MMERKIQEILGQMQKTLECSICLEMMTNPVSTPCGHQFCRFCLLECLERKKHVPCPLCKKVITKRSLLDRSQLGEMVEGVRTLIAAFQADTGTLFSPPRGPSTSVIQGTPETIRTKAADRKKQPPQRKNNVRRSTRKHSIGGSENTGEQAEEERNRKSSNGGTELAGMKPSKSTRSEQSQKDMEQNEDGTRNETVNEALLRCIEEGTHCASNVVNNAANESIVAVVDSTTTSGIETNSTETFSEIVLENKESRRSSSSSVDNNEILKPDLKQITADKHGKYLIMENISKSRLCDELKEGQKILQPKEETDLNILSGSSVGAQSEVSSGPLFKSPLDKKDLKGKPPDLEQLQFNGSNVAQRRLRSQKKRSYAEPADTESCDNEMLLDQPEASEKLLVKEQEVKRTYSRKDKEVYQKEKKSARKVKEWLKTIHVESHANKDEAADIENKEKHGQNETHVEETVKCRKRNMNKKSLKLMQEEEAMGNKLKHLAQHIQDKQKNLLFEYDDFEDHFKTLKKGEQNEKQELEKQVSEGEELIEKTCNAETVDRLCENFHRDNTEDQVIKAGEKQIEEGSASKVQLENNKIISELKVDEKPIKRKRIFKTKGNVREQNVNSYHENKNVSDKSEVNSKGFEMLECSSDKVAAAVESKEHTAPESDPYEFKSSQNTPDKPSKRKTRQTNRKKNKVVKGSAKGSSRSAEIITERSWNKDLLPNKTILRNKDIFKEISKDLEQAEEHDFITCTQEAAAQIDGAEEKEGTRKSDQFGLCTQKKVRFTEPVISDFIHTGKIDIIGYRKAKEQFSSAEQNHKTSKIERSRSDSDMEDKTEYQTEPKLPVNSEDSESDDLSEDYRFKDDSSGTDDLEIEPTQEQFEKPNLEIQPEDIKVRLSQVQTLVVPDTQSVIVNKDQSQLVASGTPSVKVNKESPEVTEVEQTPDLFKIPAFGRPLVKSGKKKYLLNNAEIGERVAFPNESLGKSTGLRTPEVGMALTVIAETPLLQENGSEVENTEAEIAVTDIDGVKIGTEQETKEAKANRNTTAKENAEEHGLLSDSDETQSPITEAFPENLDRNVPHVAEKTDSIEVIKSSAEESSQASESLLHSKVSPSKQTTSDVQKKQTGKLENKSTVSERQHLEVVSSSSPSVAATDDIERTNMSAKKKRKSFMLDEEESLDYGSLSKDVSTSVEGDSENTMRAKRQRVNRLKRSPKSNGQLHVIRSSRTAASSEIKEVRTLSEKTKLNFVQDTDRVGSESFHVISDTAEHMIVDDDHGQLGTEANRTEYNRSQSVEIISPDSIEIIDSAEDNLIGIAQRENSRNIESVCGSSVRQPRDGSKSTRKTKNTVNHLSEEHASPRNIAGNSPDDDDVQRVRHLSGLLMSPESQGLMGTKSSPEDIFKMEDTGPVLPSVDLSPQGHADKPGSMDPGLDIELLSNVESLVENDSNIKALDAAELTFNHSIEKKESRHLKEIQKQGSEVVDTEDLDQSDCLQENTEQVISERTGKNNKRSKVKAVRGFAKKKRVSDTCPFPAEGSDSDVIGSSATQQVSGGSRCTLSRSKCSPHFAKYSKLNNPVSEHTKLTNENTDIGIPTSQCVRANGGKNSRKSDNEELNTKIAKESSEAMETSCVTAGRDIAGSRNEVHVFVDANDESELSCKKLLKTTADVGNVNFSPLRKNPRKKRNDKEGDNFSAEIVQLKNDIDSDEDDCVLSPDDLPDINIGTCTSTSLIEAEDKCSKLSEQKPCLQIEESLEKQDSKPVKDKSLFSYRSRSVGKSSTRRNKYDSDIDDVVSSSSSDFKLESTDEEPDVENSALDTATEDRPKVKRNGKQLSESKSKSNITKRGSSQEKKHCEVIPESEDICSYRLDERDSEADKTCTGDGTKLRLDSRNRDNNLDGSGPGTVGGAGKTYGRMFAPLSSSESDDDDDDDDVAVVKKRVKRIIPSDSSSDEEDDSSRQMNLTSSSAFSSQSENLTTQERFALEKEVERLAKEMKLMKEQLKRNQESRNRVSGQQTPVLLDDSEEELIEDPRSDVVDEQDLFLSQPSMTLDDTPEHSVHAKQAVDDLRSNAVEFVEPEDAETLPPDVLTVPDSEPSQKTVLTIPDSEPCQKADLEVTSQETDQEISDSLPAIELSVSLHPTNKGTVGIDKDTGPELSELRESEIVISESLPIIEEPDPSLSLLDIDSREKTDKEQQQQQQRQQKESAGVSEPESGQLKALKLFCLSNGVKPSPVHGLKSRFRQEKAVLKEVDANTPRKDSEFIVRSVASKVSEHQILPEENESKLVKCIPTENSKGSQMVAEDRPVLDKQEKTGNDPVRPGIRRNVGIVVTGLTQTQVQHTKKLAALNDAKFFSKFNESVTHVVVKPADEDGLICDRTLKFFQGIAGKCWIVNFFWVLDSREAGYLLPEGPYEIQGDTVSSEAHLGPQRSRRAVGHKLFGKFHVALIGDNEFLPRDSLQDLIETCGGRVVDLKNLGQGQAILQQSKGHRVAMVISCTDLEEDDEEQNFIRQKSRDIYQGLGLVTVTREWVLDSLTFYNIQPLQDYLITDVENMKLPSI